MKKQKERRGSPPVVSYGISDTVYTYIKHRNLGNIAT